LVTIGGDPAQVKKSNDVPLDPARATTVAVTLSGARCYNRTMKECPLCGEQMKLHERQVQERAGSAARTLREWICPECDYFEEAEAGEV
jgi:hypothetical protein